MTTPISQHTWDGLMQTVTTFPPERQESLIRGLKLRFSIEEPKSPASNAPEPVTATARPATVKTASEADIRQRVLDIRAAQPGITLTDAEAQAREDVAYASGGDIDPSNMTREELQAAMAAAVAEDPDILKRDFSTGNDGPTFTDITEEEGQAMLDAQEARHRDNRVEKLVTPFKEREAADILLYGKGDPRVMDVRSQLTNALTNARNDAERAPYREALDYKPEPRPSMFPADVEDAE